MRAEERRAWARILRAVGSGTVLVGPTLRLGAVGAVACDVALVEDVPWLGRVRLALGLEPAARDAWLVPCAAAEVPEAWVVDVRHGLVERHRAPAGGRYRLREALLPGEVVALAGGGRVRLPPVLPAPPTT